MKFSIKDFFSKCDQIRRKLHFLEMNEKQSMENFIFCAVLVFHTESNLARKGITYELKI